MASSLIQLLVTFDGARGTISIAPTLELLRPTGCWQALGQWFQDPKR